HTAANDSHTASSWRKACDDNGVFGMTCRHDLLLKLINIYNSGEKLHYPVSMLADLLYNIQDQQVGVLYDIGCHLDVHIKKFFFFASPLCEFHF
ncbi:hypothetical protein CROQUDRAFT_54726, partial [Cronartium quercuum f. sp. fusiforme G11]